ncbi:uncharacterized protein [Lepeophtheirus salmonis]|uniref:uncharacterized protein n=1 Tax=Lepeophtheirus salmonis TaxID=72036 RepID=UPI001AE48F9B|nr:probable ATP-dependent RNA helicase ddx56 [Lepeophtheirus salmonis]
MFKLVWSCLLFYMILSCESREIPQNKDRDTQLLQNLINTIRDLKLDTEQVIGNEINELELDEDKLEDITEQLFKKSDRESSEETEEVEEDYYDDNDDDEYYNYEDDEDYYNY